MATVGHGPLGTDVPKGFSLRDTASRFLPEGWVRTEKQLAEDKSRERQKAAVDNFKAAVANLDYNYPGPHAGQMDAFEYARMGLAVARMGVSTGVTRSRITSVAETSFDLYIQATHQRWAPLDTNLGLQAAAEARSIAKEFGLGEERIKIADERETDLRPSAGPRQVPPSFLGPR